MIDFKIMTMDVENLGVLEAELSSDHNMSPVDSLILEARNEQVATRVIFIAPLVATASVLLLNRGRSETKYSPVVAGVGIAATALASLIRLESRQAQRQINLSLADYQNDTIQ